MLLNTNDMLVFQASSLKRLISPYLCCSVVSLVLFCLTITFPIREKINFSLPKWISLLNWFTQGHAVSRSDTSEGVWVGGRREHDCLLWYQLTVTWHQQTIQLSLTAHFHHQVEVKQRNMCGLLFFSRSYVSYYLCVWRTECQTWFSDCNVYDMSSSYCRGLRWDINGISDVLCLRGADDVVLTLLSTNSIWYNFAKEILSSWVVSCIYHICGNTFSLAMLSWSAVWKTHKWLSKRKFCGLFDLFTFKKVVSDDHWKKSSSQDEEKTDTQKVTPRRWSSGKRSRPRPLSDYGQMSIRSISIPEDAVAVESQNTDCTDGENQPRLASVGSAVQSNTVGYHRGRKRRPISVIGGVNFYGSGPAEEIEGLLTQVRLRDVLSADCRRPFHFLVSVFNVENRMDDSFSSFPFVKLTSYTYNSAFLVTNYFVLLLKSKPAWNKPDTHFGIIFFVL